MSDYEEAKGNPDVRERDESWAELTLAGHRLDELGLLHDFFDRLGRKADWPDRLKMDLLFCCEELLTNTISYGYPEGRLRQARGIELSVAWGKNDVTIVLTDDAVPFNPLLETDPDVTLQLEDRPIGGLGVFLVKKIMDEIRYERTSDGGNRLWMSKTFELKDPEVEEENR